MNRAHDLETLIIGAHALTRLAALETRDDTPAAQWRTLAILREHDALRLGELARLSRVTQPGMTRLIGTMQRAGLVERASDPDDSRAVRIRATEAGVAAYRAWRTELVDALLPRFAALSDAEWEAVRTTAALVTARLANDAPDETGDAR